jgi:hypothetical protein
MGILTRKQGEQFVISSDRDGSGITSKRASVRLSDPYQVWTGSAWSSNIEQAVFFDSLDNADNYVRENYPKLSA